MSEDFTDKTKSTAFMMDEDLLHQNIQEAAKQGKVLRIQYTDLKNKKETRNIEPYEIRDGKLWAYCRKKKGIRQFSLDRISIAKPTAHTYFPKWPVKLNQDPLDKQASSNTGYWAYEIVKPLFGTYYGAELE